MSLMARDSLRIDSRRRYALSVQNYGISRNAAIDRRLIDANGCQSYTDPLFSNKLQCAVVAPVITPSRGD